MARVFDWKMLILVGCAACASGGEDTTLENGATSPGAISGAPAPTQTTSGSAGTRSSAVATAGRTAPPTTTTTGNSASAGTQAAANGVSAGSSAAGTSGAAGSGVVAVAGSNAAAGSSEAGRSGAAGGSSAAAGSGGAASSMTEGGATDFKSPCISAGNEVVFIGDSYSDYAIAHAPLASFMQAIAIKEGALEQGQRYRNLAVAGTTLGDALTGIPSQWEGTKAMKPIKAVVMDGGGNDVLIDHPECRPDGSEKSPGCMQVVQNSLDTVNKLLDSMEATGVTDVLYFWYPHIPGGALTGYETANTISDYTYPMLEDIAKAASTDTFRVYMIPMVDLFEGHPEWFYSDGLHANDMGEEQIAQAIWKVAKENCILQASGCCAP